MRKSLLIAASIIGLSATAAFAQSGANPNAPQPNSTGTGVYQPGTTATGQAVDKPMTATPMTSKKKMKKKKKM